MRSAFAWVLVPFCLSSVACSLLHPGGKGDAGADGATAMTDGGAATGEAAENANDVARFPDEVSLNNASVKIGEAHAVAHNSVPNGTTVATLPVGTDVTQIASHEGFILATFSDPKNASHTLEGWIAQAAFGGGGAPSPRAGCPAGETTVESPGAGQFCGRVCKTDKECPAGQTCSAKANLVVNGKAGAETSTCTLPGGPSPTPPSSAAVTPSSTTIPGVQEPPGAGGTCAAKYILGSDHLCHFECNKSPLQCPPHARCTAHLTTPTTPVCEPNP